MKLFKSMKDSITKLENDVEKELNTIKSNFTSRSTPQTPIPPPPQASIPALPPAPPPFRNASGCSVTAVQRCKSIQGIKNFGGQTMYTLQILAFPDTQGKVLPTQSIIAACDSIITNALRIIDDCKKIISDTEDPKIFYERYDFLIEKCKELCRFEPFVGIYGYQPNESLVYYTNEKSRFERKMIDRCYNKALIKADSMKTEKGQMNQFIKAIESLRTFEGRMSPENIDYMLMKFMKKISP